MEDGLYALTLDGTLVRVETISGSAEGEHILGVMIDGRLDFWYAELPEDSDNFKLTRRVEPC